VPVEGGVRIAVLVALGVAVLGIGTVWLVGTWVSDENECFAAPKLLREGQSSHVRPNILPPLSRACEIRGRGEATTVIFFPWFEYLLVLCCSVLVGIALWIGLRPSWRSLAWGTAGMALSLALIRLAFQI
jgi:hypothetical protein